MKISQELQEYADGLTVAEAEAGMGQKAVELRESGGEIYVPEIPDS